MLLSEEKKQYIRCNILLKIKQLFFLIYCFIVSIILSITFAITKFNNGVCISLFFAIAILISVMIMVFNVKSTSEKLWCKAFGQITHFRTFIEIDNERISIKREGFDHLIIKQLSNITRIEKFGAAILIMFSDHTSVVLSRKTEVEDFEDFLEKEPIKSKISLSHKSFINKMLILMSACTLFIAFILSYAISDAFILGSVAWVQYSYIMYFFEIIPLIIFVIAIILKSKRCAVVAIAIIGFIALLGTFRFFFNSQIDYDVSRLNNLEYRINYELPEADRMITMDRTYFSESIGKFQSDAIVDFEKAITNSTNWLNELNLNTDNNVDYAVLNKLKHYDCFLLYDEVGQFYYGQMDNIDWYNCILLAYRLDTHSFVILYDFKS